MAIIAIIGAGPAGLKAAEVLAKEGHSITIYDQKTSPARKFLMAGRGGLNITHSEPLDVFMTHYGTAADFLRPAIEAFPPQALRDWCDELGEVTFIGSSGRVFPKSFKSSPLLRAWLIRLGNLGVQLKLNYRLQSWGYGNRPVFDTPEGEKEVKVDAILLALGGASWPKLGSDAKWVPLLEQFRIKIHTFQPSNCGFHCNLSPFFKQKFAGSPLKNITLTHRNKTVHGEIMLSKNGIEGGGIYALSAPLREDITQHHRATISIDFKPDWSEEHIAQLLDKPRGRDSLSNTLRKAVALSPVAIGLLLEDRALSMLSSRGLAQRIKHYPLLLNATFPLDRAISSAGGIDLSEVTEDFMLKKRAGIFVAGEMLDWEAPTGGYLLQASFSTAVMAANGIIKFLKN